MAVKPYRYQRYCLNALGAARKKGRKKALVVMATGLGKTVVSAFEMKRLLKQAPGRVLYLCHNNDILRQARKTFEEVLGAQYTYGYFHGTEKHMHRVDVLFASFQTMATWRKSFDKEEFRYIVVDEVHHAHAATFRPTVEYFEPEWMVGFTATPERSDGLDITTLFEGQPVYELGIFKSLARRYLCDVDYRVMTDEIQNAGVLDTPIGKLSIAELNRTIFIPKRDEEIVRIIGEKSAETENPRVMIFCASIEHAERMAALMPHATVVHSKLKAKEKDQRLDAFRRGEADTILTVDMLNEGIDVPEANVIVFLRSTASRRIFLQQLGRGLRKALGKLKVLVLDFVANCERIEMIDQLHKGVKDEQDTIPPGPAADDEEGGEPPEHPEPIQPGVRDEGVDTLPPGPVADGEEEEENERPEPMTLTLDGIEFDERLWRLMGVIREIRDGYTVEGLTTQLLRKAEELKRPPTTGEVNGDTRMANATTFMEAFDTTWNGVLEAVGLNPVHLKRFQGTSREELTAHLLRKYRELRRVPKQREVQADPTMPSLQIFLRVFNTTWSGVLEEVGIIALRRPSYTTESLKTILLEKAKQLGRTPTQIEVSRDPSLPSIATFKNTFKTTWNGVLETVGLVVNVKTARSNYSREELKTRLLKKARELGKPPTQSQVRRDPSLPTEWVVVKVFEVDSWDEVLRKIGLQ